MRHVESEREYNNATTITQQKTVDNQKKSEHQNFVQK